MPTILVVEADHLLRSAIAAYLRKQRHVVFEATGVMAALEVLGRQFVQAAVIDTHPWQSVELLKQIRGHPTLAGTPVIAIVGHDNIAEVLEYLEPGEYLRIPFDMPFLDWLLQKLLGEQAQPETDPPAVDLSAFKPKA